MFECLTVFVLQVIVWIVVLRKTDEDVHWHTVIYGALIASGVVTGLADIFVHSGHHMLIYLLVPIAIALRIVLGGI